MPTRPPQHRAQTTFAGDERHDGPAQRASASARGYGRRWAKLSLMFRRRHPLCADPFGVHAALGTFAAATQVDHIIPRGAGGSDAWSNLQALCAACHSRKTVTCDGGFGRAQDRYSRSLLQRATDEDRGVQTHVFSRVSV